ncbi:hypothetical protein ACFL1E_00950 [Candidatus Omnitrophota bacterium]
MKKVLFIFLSVAIVGCIVLCSMSELAAQYSAEDYKKRIEYLSKHPEKARKYTPESLDASVEPPDEPSDERAQPPEEPLDESIEPSEISGVPCAERADHLEKCEPYMCQKEDDMSPGNMITQTIEGFAGEMCVYRLVSTSGREMVCKLSDDQRAKFAKSMGGKEVSAYSDLFGAFTEALETGECVIYENGEVVPIE